MRKMLYLFLAGLALGCVELQAEVETQDIGTENIVTATGNDKAGPFKIDITGDYVGKAKVHKDCFDGHLKFATAVADLNVVYYYNDCYEEGLSAALSYERTFFDWDENPFFTQKNYNTVSLILGGFSKRLPDWFWRGQVSINFDNIDHWNSRDYMNYDILLWGRYNWCDNVGVHIGFLAQTGMKIDRVYPVIGLDWQWGCHWKFNAIYPLNISAIYMFNSSWSVGVAARFLDQRHRVKRDEVLSEGLWHYQTTGAEFAINYTPNKWIDANIHAGYDFGGHVKIADRHYNHGRRLRIDGAPYAGAELVINF